MYRVYALVWMIRSVSREYGVRMSSGFLLCLLTASALIDARGENMDSRLAVLARIEDSSPRSRVRFFSGTLILHLKSAVEPINLDEKTKYLKIHEKKAALDQMFLNCFVKNFVIQKEEFCHRPYVTNVSPYWTTCPSIAFTS